MDPKQAKRDARTAWERAELFFDRGDFREAAQQYQAVVAVDSDSEYDDKARKRLTDLQVDDRAKLVGLLTFGLYCLGWLVAFV